MNELQKKVLREILSKIKGLYLAHPGQKTDSPLEQELISLNLSDRGNRDEAIEWLKVLIKSK